MGREYDELAAQREMRHAAVVAGLNREIAAKTATIADMTASHAAAIAALEAENATLKAQTVAKLTELITTVKAGLAFEILPVRPDDGRRFAVSHDGPVPPLPSPPAPPPPPPVPAHLTFDSAWCAAVCEVERELAIHCGTRTPWRIVHPGGRCLTLRSTGPLPRLLPGQEQHQSSGYRVLVHSYGGNAACRLGFVPSHVLDSEGAAPILVDVTAVPNRGISNFGGWHIEVRPLEHGTIIDATRCGWIVLPPSHAIPNRGGRVQQRRTSSYATTTKVPPLSAGSAVEFVVDHAAGTCRVAFYAPAAVWNNFETPPFAKMELCFVATAAQWECAIPARLVPTVPISRVELYPAVEADHAGAIWRLVPLEAPDESPDT
jgi:hypothetical protein